MIRNINRDEIKGMMDRAEKFVIVNVLDEESYREEHICGSINIPVEKIGKEAVDRVKKNETVVVHCSGPACKASESAANKLNELGYKDVRRFEGGMEDWKKANYCVEGEAYAGVRVA